MDAVWDDQIWSGSRIYLRPDAPLAEWQAADTAAAAAGEPFYVTAGTYTADLTSETFTAHVVFEHGVTLSNAAGATFSGGVSGPGAASATGYAGGITYSTSDPTVNDDSADGYGIGSLRMNTSTNKIFVCLDPSSGAADWREVVVLNEDGELVGPIIVRTGTAAELDAIVLEDGEIAYATDTEQLRVGDGATAGGRGRLIHNTNSSVQADSGGNARGTNAVDLQSSRSNATEVASGEFSTVSGGSDNTASDYYSTVGGGDSNTASGELSTVSGGGANEASDYYSTVGGGDSNTASGNSSTVSGGYSNTASGYYSIVGCGRNNTASGNSSTVSGGYSNTASGDYSTVVGGRSNTASGENSAVIGYLNQASGAYSTVFGGYSNTAGGSSSIVSGGSGNVVSGSFSSVSGGKNGLADKYGQHAHSAGKFAVVGDAQYSQLIARNSTSNATATELFLDGSSSRISIPTDTAWEFDVHIVAAEQGMANIKKFHRTGLIVNDGGSTSISTVDTIATDREIASPGAWDVTLSANDANNALKIEVEGEAATNIRWVARIELTEVSYPA